MSSETEQYTFAKLMEMLNTTMMKKAEALASFTTAFLGKEHMLDVTWDFICRQNNWINHVSSTLRTMLMELVDMLPSHTLIPKDTLLKDCNYITDMVRIYCLSTREFSLNLARLTAALNTVSENSTTVFNYRNEIRRAEAAMTF